MGRTESSLPFFTLKAPSQVDGCDMVNLDDMFEAVDNTAGIGLYIQWINFEYTKDKFKISSNSNSLFIFWIYLKYILQFDSILFSAYI